MCNHVVARYTARYALPIYIPDIPLINALDAISDEEFQVCLAELTSAQEQWRIGEVTSIRSSNDLAQILGFEIVPAEIHAARRRRPSDREARRFETREHEIRVRIKTFRRFKDCVTELFPHDGNEVLMLAQEALVDPGDLSPPASEDRRQVVVFTNKLLSSDAIGSGLRQWQFLRCRYICELPCFPESNKQGSIRRLTASEVPDNSQYSFRARALKVPESILLIDWTGRDSAATRGRYTFGDSFCGVGGASCGAEQAGLRPKWAFDNSLNVTRSYLDNFQSVTFHAINADDFLTIPSRSLRVDVLHLSPSCQSFSAMNTAPNGGQHGDLHRDSFLSCIPIIRHCRPRIVTMEQVPGLLHDGKSHYFDDFLRGLVEMGFSVRWQILDVSQHGVPQRRQRLIILAAAPGQHLPDLPSPSQESTTINQYLAPELRRTDHETIWQGTVLASGSITDITGDPLPIPVMAAIQSFPETHRFSTVRTEAIRQIGNAVPPELARCVFTEVIRALRTTDAELLSRSTR